MGPILKSNIKASFWLLEKGGHERKKRTADARIRHRRRIARAAIFRLPMAEFIYFVAPNLSMSS